MLPLTICMIVKNEAENIGRCLETLKNLNYPIVVCDTGSGDDTCAIAAEYGAKVVHFSWNDDFSAPRNKCAEEAGTDWIMVIDADEALDVGQLQPQVFEKALEPLVKYLDDGILKRENKDSIDSIDNIDNKNNTACSSTDTSDENAEMNIIPPVGRIIRRNLLKDSVRTERIRRIYNKKYYSYRGLVHEQILPIPTSDGTAPALLTDIDTGIIFDHYGYLDSDIEDSREHRKEFVCKVCVSEESSSGEADGSADSFDGSSADSLMKRKAQRNLRLLKKSLPEGGAEECSDPYLLFQLGQCEVVLENYRSACDYLERALSNTDMLKVTEDSYGLDMVDAYGYALLEAGERKKALEVEHYYDVCSVRSDYLLMLGHVYMSNAMFEEAVLAFDAAVTVPLYAQLGANSFLPRYNKGVILEVLGLYSEAKEAYEVCGAYEPAVKRLKAMKDAGH